LVSKTTVGAERSRATLRVVGEHPVKEALEAVEPSLPERLVDRFERLLDGVLADDP
jgi:hypothetical protein